MSERARVTRCPTCGRPGMRPVVRSIEVTVRGKPSVVPNVEVDECPHCGERLYDLQALRKIRDARRPQRRTKAA